jgi:hypothetical protein
MATTLCMATTQRAASSAAADGTRSAPAVASTPAAGVSMRRAAAKTRLWAARSVRLMVSSSGRAAVMADRGCRRAGGHLQTRDAGPVMSGVLTGEQCGQMWPAEHLASPAWQVGATRVSGMRGRGWLVDLSASGGTVGTPGDARRQGSPVRLRSVKDKPMLRLAPVPLCDRCGVATDPRLLDHSGVCEYCRKPKTGKDCNCRSCRP